jgi:flagellar basal body-associated protein FliL
MAKLDALKDKISQAQTSVSDKLDKIALFKKWKEKRAQKKATGPASYSLGAIYREGSTGTRLQVIVIYALAIAALFFTFQSGRKIFARLGKSVENEKLKADYAHGLEELSHKVVEKATLVSMGKFTTNVYQPGKSGGFLVVDVWLRVSDPTAAEFAQKNETIVYDAIVDAFSQAFKDEINPLTDEGAEVMKGRVAEAVNMVMHQHGKAEEVFFQNMIVQ